jgi:hypothetical protein
MLARLLAIFVGTFVAAAVSSALAEPVAANRTVDLDHDVLPLLKARCVKCHGPAKQEAKLRLSSGRSLARGSENGPVVAAGGKLDASLLWEKVEGEEMPPDEPLPAEERAVLRRWIEQGAPGLPAIDPADTSSDHWAFRPLSKPAPPDVRDSAAFRTPVDAFIVAELKQRGLALRYAAKLTGGR